MLNNNYYGNNTILPNRVCESVCMPVCPYASMRACMYARLYVRMSACMPARKWRCFWVPIFRRASLKDVCTYVCIYVCMYVLLYSISLLLLL